MDIITVAFTSLNIALTVPLITLLGQTLAVFLIPEGDILPLECGTRPRVGILIPAHNEAGAITRTVASLKPQLSDHDYCLVIADNCSDDTEILARRAGAEVLVRKDDRRGKGYALHAGLQQIAREPSMDVVVVLDADCLLDTGSLEILARTCKHRNEPVQALYLMTSASPDHSSSRIAEFAWRVKALLRPLGCLRLRLPCQLMGTGMAFPRALLERYNLATGHVAEDAALSLELSANGHPPWLCPAATVRSTFPVSDKGRSDQKKRWIHGYLSVIRHVPRLLRRTIQHRDINSLAVALDLTIPPLALLAALCAFAGALSTIWFLFSDSFVPLLISVGNVTPFALFSIFAWTYCGKDLIGRKELAALPHHVGHVVGATWLYFRGRRSDWKRAERPADAELP